jgi:radical SAM protein with 4Fe4S-binding SPASM domain
MVSTHEVDLGTADFRTGWEALARFSEQPILPGYDCHSCEKRFLCGLCPAHSGLEAGSPHRKLEYLCELGTARLRSIEPLLGR